MLSWTVSIKLAKLLKEKGFDQKCGSYYDTVSKSRIKDTPPSNYNGTREAVSIPSIVDVVMWLLEKHEIWIVADLLLDYKRWDFKVVNLKNSNSSIEWYVEQLQIPLEDIIKNSFETPKEAYQAAIYHVLKNMI